MNFLYSFVDQMRSQSGLRSISRSKYKETKGMSSANKPLQRHHGYMHIFSHLFRQATCKSRIPK